MKNISVRRFVLAASLFAAGSALECSASNSGSVDGGGQDGSATPDAGGASVESSTDGSSPGSEGASGVDSREFAVVTEVDPESASAKAGLARGDIILELDRKSVHNADEAVKLSDEIKGPKVLVRLWRGGTSRYVVVDETPAAP